VGKKVQDNRAVETIKDKRELKAGLKEMRKLLKKSKK